MFIKKILRRGQCNREIYYVDRCCKTCKGNQGWQKVTWICFAHLFAQICKKDWQNFNPFSKILALLRSCSRPHDDHKKARASARLIVNIQLYCFSVI